MSYYLNIKKLNNVYGMVQTNHPSIMSDLYNFLSMYVEGYKFMPKYKIGVWDGKVHLMERNGKFPLGLVKYIYKFCKIDGLALNIDPEIIEKYNPDEDFLEVTNQWVSETFSPRAHQLQGALKALKYQRCILEHATSSGKSLTMAMIIMYNLIKKRAKKILVLVPGLSLIEQLTNDFIEYGIPVDWIGKYSGLQKDEGTPILISTWQSMAKNKELSEEFDMLLSDECHTLKASVVKSVSENCINARIRVGCTGTMPEPQSEKMVVEGALGPVIDRVSAKDLIELGHISDIKIKIPFIIYPDSIKKELKGVPFDVEKQWLEQHVKRTKVLKKIIEKHTAKDHNCLLLVDHIEHANSIVEQMKEIPNVEVFLVTGEMPAAERERIRQYTNVNKRVIIVATYQVFSTGISIKRLHVVLFASAGKSKIRTLQSIGRGLRIHNEKNHLTLYDIGDNLHYAEKHLQKRLEIYTKAEFDIDIFEIKLGIPSANVQE